MATLETIQNTEINLSERAAQEIRSLLERMERHEAALRVYVTGGGCSGLSYQMGIEEQVDEGDLLFNCHGVNVVVDPISINYVRGASIDFVEDEMGGGFKIDNPNAVRSCGCGSSFSTEEGQEGGGCGSGGCGSGGCGSH